MCESWDVPRSEGLKQVQCSRSPDSATGMRDKAREVGRHQIMKGLISRAKELGLYPVDKRKLWKGFQEGCGMSCSDFRISLWLLCKNGVL